MAGDQPASREPQDSALLVDPQQLRLDFERTYLDGKMRRYALLFSVNGASFAILKLFSDPEGNFDLPGLMTKEAIAAGAVGFTALMLVDLWAYAAGMRRLEACWVASEKISARPNERGIGAFTGGGKLILLLMSALIAFGWTLAALEEQEYWNAVFLSDCIYIVAVLYSIVKWIQDKKFEEAVLKTRKSWRD